MEPTQEPYVEEVLPKYNLNPEQEKNEIIRHYRALLRSLRPKLKKGDKIILSSFGAGFTWGAIYFVWSMD